MTCSSDVAVKMPGTVFSPCRTWRYTLQRNLVGKEPIGDADRTLFTEGCPTCNDLYYMCGSPEVCLEERLPRSVLFVGLNPSTADEEKDDPTVRRMAGFARLWGFEQLLVCNLYALRARDPKELARCSLGRVGPDNDYWMAAAAAGAERVVAAWGGSGPRDGRAERVATRLRAIGPVFALGFTRRGEPRHPLYLRGDTELVSWGGRGS